MVFSALGNYLSSANFEFERKYIEIIHLQQLFTFSVTIHTNSQNQTYNHKDTTTNDFRHFHLCSGAIGRALILDYAVNKIILNFYIISRGLFRLTNAQVRNSGFI